MLKRMRILEEQVGRLSHTHAHMHLDSMVMSPAPPCWQLPLWRLTAAAPCLLPCLAAAAGCPVCGQVHQGPAQPG